MPTWRFTLKGVFLTLLVCGVLGLAIGAIVLSRTYAPTDWGDFDVLKRPPPRPDPRDYANAAVPYAEYEHWIGWGQDWFRNQTFGNERLWTDVVGLFNGTIDVPNGSGGWNKEPFFRYFLQAIDALDGSRGNLYQGNGGGYTNDLTITFPPGALLDRTFPLPEQLHTGLDVEAGAAWPLGVVPVAVTGDEESKLPYLLDPAAFSRGSDGLGPLPTPAKFRVGLSCALCHYSLDIDWDGVPDLRSAQPAVSTPNSPYKPEHAWAIGNQDLALGWIFAMSANTVAGFANSAPVGGTTAKDARQWGQFIHANYRTHPDLVKREVDRGLLVLPRGYADDTPDGLHNPLQFPSLYTHRNWPYNYDGVMVNASDRNNNVWTTGLDLSQLVALCKDRGGKTAGLVFWKEPGLYSVLTAEEYAEIIVQDAPAVRYDPSRRASLVADILGKSDSVPGLLRNDGIVLIRGVPNAVPATFFNGPASRTREAKQFGPDGASRGPMVGLLGTRVVSPVDLRSRYNVDSLQERYGINPDEFVSDAVSMMLDWAEPPPNVSPLLANARAAGWVERGYQIFKSHGCDRCHAGPFFTDNRIVRLRRIGTDSARASATSPLQSFLAPIYSPRTGKATGGGVLGILAGLFAGKKPGYKTVTLRYLWGSAPYLHDGGVGVTLQPGAAPQGVDLQRLLSRPDTDKLYGIAQILTYRDAHPETWLRPNAALSLQALLLQSERLKVISANEERAYPVPGRTDSIPIAAMHIHGIGHPYWINDAPGGDTVTALVAFLLALDNDPGR